MSSSTDTSAMVELLASQWTELKTLVEAVGLDVAKSLNGNVSAGVRARKGMRYLKKLTHQASMTSLEIYKAGKPENEVKE